MKGPQIALVKLFTRNLSTCSARVDIAFHLPTVFSGRIDSALDLETVFIFGINAGCYIMKIFVKTKLITDNKARAWPV